MRSTAGYLQDNPELRAAALKVTIDAGSSLLRAGTHDSGFLVLTHLVSRYGTKEYHQVRPAKPVSDELTGLLPELTEEDSYPKAVSALRAAGVEPIQTPPVPGLTDFGVLATVLIIGARDQECRVSYMTDQGRRVTPPGAIVMMASGDMSWAAAHMSSRGAHYLQTPMPLRDEAWEVAAGFEHFACGTPVDDLADLLMDTYELLDALVS